MNEISFRTALKQIDELGDVALKALGGRPKGHT